MKNRRGMSDRVLTNTNNTVGHNYLRYQSSKIEFSDFLNWAFKQGPVKI